MYYFSFLFLNHHIFHSIKVTASGKNTVHIEGKYLYTNYLPMPEILKHRNFCWANSILAAFNNRIHKIFKGRILAGSAIYKDKLCSETERYSDLLCLCIYL